MDCSTYTFPKQITPSMNLNKSQKQDRGIRTRDLLVMKSDTLRPEPPRPCHLRDEFHLFKNKQTISVETLEPKFLRNGENKMQGPSTKRFYVVAVILQR